MVGPKKEALAIAEGELKAAEDKLSIKKAMNSGTAGCCKDQIHGVCHCTTAGASCDSAIKMVHSFCFSQVLGDLPVHLVAKIRLTTSHLAL